MTSERSVEPRVLLAELARSDVSACVWKGSTHLADSLAGRGDLDVLVAEADRVEAREVLRRHGYLPADRAHPADQPGIEDWFSVHRDYLVQVQLYHQLVVGDLVRGWRRVPRERQVLQGRRPSPEGPLVPSPDVDALLLLVRAAVSSRRRDRLVRPPWRRDLSRWAAEWDLLLAGTSLRHVARLAGDWFGPDTAIAVSSVSSPLALADLVRLRSLMVPQLSDGLGDSLPRRLVRVVALAVHRLDRRRGRGTVLVKRGLPGRGIWVIATGTHANELADTVRAFFGAKFDAHRLRLDRTTPASARDRMIRRALSARDCGLLVVCTDGAASKDVAALGDVVVVGEGELRSAARSAVRRVWAATSEAASR